MKNWIFKGVLPLAFLAFLLYVFKSIYLIDGQIDWFRLWMIAGMPFGLVHFFIGIIPHILSDKGTGRIFIIEQYARNTAKIMKK